MFEEEDLLARARAIVHESRPEEGSQNSPRQRVSGSNNFAVQGNNNQVHFNASSQESYDAYTTVQLVEEEQLLAADLDRLEKRRSGASLLTLAVALSPPALCLMVMKYLPAGWMLGGWGLAMGAGLLGWLWGVHHQAQLAQACRAVRAKLATVQAHLLQRSNWHPLGVRSAR